MGLGAGACAWRWRGWTLCTERAGDAAIATPVIWSSRPHLLVLSEEVCRGQEAGQGKRKGCEERAVPCIRILTTVDELSCTKAEVNLKKRVPQSTKSPRCSRTPCRPLFLLPATEFRAKQDPLSTHRSRFLRPLANPLRRAVTPNFPAPETSLKQEENPVNAQAVVVCYTKQSSPPCAMRGLCPMNKGRSLKNQ